MSDTHPGQIARRDHWRNPGREDTKYAKYMTPVDERKDVIYRRARAEGKTLGEAIDLAGYDDADATYAKAREEGCTDAEAWERADAIRDAIREIRDAFDEADRLHFGEGLTVREAHLTALRELGERFDDVERFDTYIAARVAEVEAMEEGCPELAAYYRAYYSPVEAARREKHAYKAGRPTYEPTVPYPEEAVAAWDRKLNEAASEEAA